MNKLAEWKDLTYETLSPALGNIASAIPNILGAIVVLIIGWFVRKAARFALKKLFKLAKVNRLSDKINDAKLLGDGNLNIDIEKIVLGFVKWLLLLVFVIIAADMVKLTIISNEIANLLRYLPVLLSAIVILVVGLYVASMIRTTLVKVFKSMAFTGSKVVSSVVYYIMAVFVTITALNHAGINTTIITNNFTIILGAFLLAFALGLGLGSRDVVASLLKTFYARKKYNPGEEIKVNGVIGTIESIDHMFLTLKTAKGRLVLPINEVVENRVELD